MRHFLALVLLARSADMEKSGGAEIDKTILDVEVRKALAMEHRRRAEWQHRELSAKSFAAEYGHAGDAAAPHGAHDQVA